MPEKFQDRLFRVTCSAYGNTRRVADVLMAMTDEQLSLTFDSLLENALQSGEIEVPEVTPDIPEQVRDYLAAGGVRCPVCKSENISGDEWGSDAGICWQKVHCEDCGSEWHDEYQLVNITIIYDSTAPQPAKPAD
jgi:hypothetical protein